MREEEEEGRTQRETGQREGTVGKQAGSRYRGSSEGGKGQESGNMM